MGWLRFAAIALLLAGPALAQGYGVGHTPTPDELRALDISIGPEGEGLPPGHGTPAEGAIVFQQKGCAGCHGKAGVGGLAPPLQSSPGGRATAFFDGRILPLTSPSATTVWDFIHRGMPLGKEGTLTPNEVYALTAYLLSVNHVIGENDVLDQDSLPKVKMPDRDDYARLPEWKHGAPRLQGYPY